MNFKHIVLIAFGLSVALFGKAEEPREYKLTLGNFTELKVNDPVNVEYNCSVDSIGQVYFVCDPSVVDKLMFTHNKKSLSIQVADDYDGTLPLVKVYSTNLERVENGSDSTIIIASNRPTTTFKARVMGNGTIVINELETSTARLNIMTGRGQIRVADGTAFKAKYSNVGTGTIQAGNLKATQVGCTISGTGSIDCTATETLTISGIGSGTVYYGGHPAKVSNRSIGIKAIAIDK